MDSETLAAISSARTVVEADHYDAIKAAQAMRRLAVLAPPHVEPMVHKAARVIAKSLTHRGSAYDTAARYNLKQLVTAMERSFLRVVK